MKKNSIIGVISLVCSMMLFMAILRLPSEYYMLLRIFIFSGSLLIILLTKAKKNYWTILLTVIALLFNPIYPIYLYKKSVWILLDIIVGIIFLYIFFKRNPRIKVHKKKGKTVRKYERDRIY